MITLTPYRLIYDKMRKTYKAKILEIFCKGLRLLLIYFHLLPFVLQMTIAKEAALMDTIRGQTYKEKDQQLIHSSENLSKYCCHKMVEFHPLKRDIKMIKNIQIKYCEYLERKISPISIYCVAP